MRLWSLVAVLVLYKITVSAITDQGRLSLESRRVAKCAPYISQRVPVS